ncbi:MAG: hypothetical protein K2Q21_07080 [Chitinophagaceae bacterium]|nr:hypothetical protein [Chitinophagaceae bacterium]
MTRLLIFIFLFIGLSSFGQIGDTSFGKPIFWYRISDPRAMFMGAEGPLFILYINGKILFWKNGAYNLTQVEEGEKTQLISELNLTDTLFKKSRFFNATISAPNGEILATDNPSYSVFVKLDTLVCVSVCGYVSSKDYRKRFPSQVLNIHNFILNFDAEKSIKWIPDRIEIMLSDYSHSPDIPIQWPTNWPNLNSPDTRKQGSYVTSIFLEKKYLNQLTELLKKRREKQAFEINGKKYFIGYRFPIPGLY